MSSAEVRNYAPLRFSLRTVMVLMAAVSILMGVTLWQYRGLMDAHSAGVRDAYLHGRISLEDAREQVGDRADNWSADVHERARAAREQRKK